MDQGRLGGIRQTPGYLQKQPCNLPEETGVQLLCAASYYGAETWARIHESVITYDGHISRPGITELELGPSENSYSRARKRSVIVVLEVGGFIQAV